MLCLCHTNSKKKTIHTQICRQKETDLKTINIVYTHTHFHEKKVKRENATFHIELMFLTFLCLWNYMLPPLNQLCFLCCCFLVCNTTYQNFFYFKILSHKWVSTLFLWIYKYLSVCVCVYKKKKIFATIFLKSSTI